MILPCPACQSRFMVPDERITRKGIKIRCPKCRFVFIMKAGTDAPGSSAARQTPAPAAKPAQAAAAGMIAPAKKEEPSQRRAPEERHAEKVSEQELADMVDEEIVDMDELVQATEQSGFATKAAPKLEHTLPQDTGGPSVILDNSLMSAAAAHTATLGADVEPAHEVSDTWMDYGPKAVEAEPEPAQDKWPTPPSAPPPAPPPVPEMPAHVPPAVPTQQAEAITPKDGIQGAEPAAVDQDEDFDLDVDLDEDAGFDVDIDDGVISGMPAADSAPLEALTSYTLSAVAPEHDELTELEGLLVEEKRALQKGPAAKIIAVIGIVGAVTLLSLLGYLLHARLNPPKTKPPAWGNLQLHNLKHDLVQTKSNSSVVRVEVQVNNASKLAKYRNVHIKASILSTTGTKKCENNAPCGLWLSRKEVAAITRDSYHKVIKNKAKSTAYNVQLNPGQQERCQVLLFCGDRYRVGQDRIKVEIDKERSTRLKE